jgi:hypothetical protein
MAEIISPGSTGLGLEATIPDPQGGPTKASPAMQMAQAPRNEEEGRREEEEALRRKEEEEVKKDLNRSQRRALKQREEEEKESRRGRDEDAAREYRKHLDSEAEDAATTLERELKVFLREGRDNPAFQGGSLIGAMQFFAWYPTFDQMILAFREAHITMSLLENLSSRQGGKGIEINATNPHAGDKLRMEILDKGKEIANHLGGGFRWKDLKWVNHWVVIVKGFPRKWGEKEIRQGLLKPKGFPSDHLVSIGRPCDPDGRTGGAACLRYSSLPERLVGWDRQGIYEFRPTKIITVKWSFARNPQGYDQVEHCSACEIPHPSHMECALETLVDELGWERANMERVKARERGIPGAEKAKYTEEISSAHKFEADILKDRYGKVIEPSPPTNNSLFSTNFPPLYSTSSSLPSAPNGNAQGAPPQAKKPPGKASGRGSAATRGSPAPGQGVGRGEPRPLSANMAKYFSKPSGTGPGPQQPGTDAGSGGKFPDDGTKMINSSPAVVVIDEEDPIHDSDQEAAASGDQLERESAAPAKMTNTPPNVPANEATDGDGDAAMDSDLEASAICDQLELEMEISASVAETNTLPKDPAVETPNIVPLNKMGIGSPEPPETPPRPNPGKSPDPKKTKNTPPPPKITLSKKDWKPINWEEGASGYRSNESERN